MKISEVRRYLDGVHSSVTHLFFAVSQEEAQIGKWQSKLPKEIDPGELASYIDHSYALFLDADTSEESDHVRSMHAYGRYAVACNLLVAHEVTAGVLYAAILQIAKQAISITFRENGRDCGHGRVVAGLPLSRVIWDARNQALHFEESRVKNKTRETFDELARNVGGQFDIRLSPGKNMARPIVTDVIGWQDAEGFLEDMIGMCEVEG